MKKRVKRLHLTKETVRTLMAPAWKGLLAARGGTAGSVGSHGNSLPCCPNPCVLEPAPSPRPADRAAGRGGFGGKKTRG